MVESSYHSHNKHLSIDDACHRLSKRRQQQYAGEPHHLEIPKTLLMKIANAQRGYNKCATMIIDGRDGSSNLEEFIQIYHTVTEETRAMIESKPAT
jgi:hypothetical protein